MLAWGATFLIDIGQGEAVVGDPGDVYVEWTAGDGSSAAGFVAFPEGARGSETLSLRVKDDEATMDGVTRPVYFVTTAIAFLLGFVVEYSVRGYGYVRGTGQAARRQTSTSPRIAASTGGPEAYLVA